MVLRIALVSEHASPLAAIGAVDAGGQNVHVAELASGLTRLGHEVVVYTRRDDPGLPATVRTDDAYDVVHLDAGPAQVLPKDDLWPLMPAFATALRTHLEVLRPDVVHAHFWMSGWAATRAARGLGIATFVTFHALGSVKRRHQGAADTSPADRLDVELTVARRATGVVATCRDEVAELAAMGVDLDRVDVVPCGVDVRHFTTGAAPLDHPPRRQPHRIVSVGRLVPRKGYATIVEALVDLPGVELVIAGGHATDGVEVERLRLEALAAELGVADRVQFAGQVGHFLMPALLCTADVVVCSPWYEPFGLVPLEAMACGVPVVASAVGGMLDSVADGETGLLVPPQDPAALAAALGGLLADPQRRAAYGRAGVVRARSLYSWDVVAAATAEVYDRAVAALGSAPAATLGAGRLPVLGPA
ncbi:Glycosyltransferase involved in cell wall bisynthesis [Microlunatus sagamiharensis]|uniref:Glycosyltransferase involved in cell wall bisynthesis n=1 Tax=Microlunatus sagamiharensis TaxID=546874 RepID=A0A1H2NEI4_9ACTN|nr:Glycosyltransferase involved in cell wall bisynthesis [Microlunatus sagamiharensis]